MPDRLLPISALQHLVFCERQCALIHLEQAWAENVLTAQGRLDHQRVDRPGFEARPGVKAVRGLWLRSERLKLVGRADLVEFRPLDGGGEEVFPVEHKRGRKRDEPGSKIQLCAQAVCLEEMLGLEVAAGAIFFGLSRRRLEVVFDPELRERTTRAAARLHRLIDSGQTPPAVYSKSCRSCSLLDLCQPRLTGPGRSAKAYLDRCLAQHCQEGGKGEGSS